MAAASAARASLCLGNGACTVLDDNMFECLGPSNCRSWIIVESEKSPYCLGYKVAVDLAYRAAVPLGYNAAVAVALSNCRGVKPVEILELKGAACVENSKRAKRAVKRQRKCIVTCLVGTNVVG